MVLHHRSSAGFVLTGLASSFVFALCLSGALAAIEDPPDENEIQGRGFHPGKLYQDDDEFGGVAAWSRSSPTTTGSR